MKVIVYRADGEFVVIFPSQQALAEYTLQEIADKDVPAGEPYKIVDADEVADLPPDVELTCGVGSESKEFCSGCQEDVNGFSFIQPREEFSD